MSSTCFKGRRLYIQLWHGTFYMQRCKQSSRLIQYSWRWTLGFETCRRHQKIKN